MADFKKAWPKTSRNEAGYANNSKDSGKETYRGISIVNNPDCPIWPIVHKTIFNLGINNTLDAGKTIWTRIDTELAKIPGLDEMVSNFYKLNYWDKLNLDNEPDQLIAETVFDTAVNLGCSVAKQFIKQAENDS